MHRGKCLAEAQIAHFKACIADADIEHVEAPTDRKDVEIVWDDGEFHVEQGSATGVYYEPERGDAERVHVDWSDDRDRTTVTTENLISIEESDYYIDGTS